MGTRVLILGFGGTIAMVPDQTGALVPAQSVDDLLRLVPTLSQKADIQIRQLVNLDSTNVTPAHWTQLTYEISEVIERGDCDAIIVTHGTDTMAYTATAVALAFGRGLKIPVVFTGAQKPMLAFGTDARFNLENAMETALQAHWDGVVEVMIAFHDRVFRASRTIKVSEASFTAFDSPAFPPLAIIDAVGVHFIPQARKKDQIVATEVQPHFQRGILTIDLVPGLEPQIIIAMLRGGNCKGLVLKSLGAGNVPSLDEYSLLPIIEEAVKNLKIPVIVATKFVGGQTHMDIYEPGRRALEAGAIPAADLTDVAAQVKFMWALAQGLHDSREALMKIICTDVAGEITVAA